MSRNVIEITNLSKQYRLGQVGATTISDDLKRWWYRVRGLEDPFLKIGDENDRSKKANSDYVWALRDINFNVEQGEVLGIIGKNGAGKSTLLKILSRTTSPTLGEYKIKGRVASLLEVGTGFHPDLTGRENVFLNGAILGMSKAEIRKNFDEIVDFSGVERYIDTPVKRYSSGMYVRLAFAVAAHLEPEILIVDEVLAVGDQEFQDKCLGKMRNVSNSGRTVLFVSHNLGAVQNLCSSCVYMKYGQVVEKGSTPVVIESYLSENKNIQVSGEIPADFYRMYSNGEAFFKKILVSNLKGQTISTLGFNEPFKVSIEFEALKDLKNVMLNINLGTTLGQPILFAVEKDNYAYVAKNYDKGLHKIEASFNVRLLPGKYSFTIGINYVANGVTIDWVENVYFITVDKAGYNKNESYPWDHVHGYIEPETKWDYKK